MMRTSVGTYRLELAGVVVLVLLGGCGEGSGDNSGSGGSTSAGDQCKDDVPAGFGPISVAAADLSGDGKLDLAVVNFYGGDVGVLLNQGNATFAAAALYPANKEPHSGAVADLNGDGKLDIAVAGSLGGTVSVLLNQDEGTFATPVHYDVGYYVVSVAAGDLNGDGQADIVFSDNSTGFPNDKKDDVGVMLNEGSGTFAVPVYYGVGAGSNSVVAADLDGDGEVDLAFTHGPSALGGPGVSVLLNQGNGAFAAAVTYAAGTVPFSVTAEDVNGDGKIDLAVANYGGSDASVLLNQGDGTFAAPMHFATGDGPTSVAAADLNGDGKTDLAVTNAKSDTVSVLLNQDNTTFGQAVQHSAGSIPRSVTAADLDGDGRADLAVANGDSKDVSILRFDCPP